jgi:hypothetical protein
VHTAHPEHNRSHSSPAASTPVKLKSHPSGWLFNLNGARGSKLDEPLLYQRNYQVEWVAPRVNLRELALLRFIQGKTERELAQYFGRSKTAIHELLVRMVKNDFRLANLTQEDL